MIAIDTKPGGRQTATSSDDYCAERASSGLAFPALAQFEPGDGGKSVQITPYVWASGFGGTLRPGPGAPTVHVDKSFGELMEDVDAAFFISGLVAKAA